MSNNSQKGVSLIITFFILTIILAVVLSISAILYKEIRIIRNMGNSVVAFSAADSGVEKVLYYDRKEKPAGAVNAVSGICRACNSGLESCAFTGEDCDDDSCKDCEISFDTDMGNGKDYTITAKISPDEINEDQVNLTINSLGNFKSTKRAILVTNVFYSGVDDGQWLNGWSHRKRITIQNNYINSDLTDFPLYVKISGSSGSDMSKAQNGGDDIRFTSSDGLTLLKYEKESWSGGGGSPVTADFWVKAPALANLNLTPTDIYIYYGNASASDGQDPPSVWDNNFMAVWHMDSFWKDSKGGHNGTSSGATAVPGYVYSAGNFDAIDDYISFSSIALGRPASYTMWYKGTDRNNQYRDLINPAQDYGPHLSTINKLYWYEPGFAGAASINSIELSVWYYIGFVIDDSGNLTYYMNGNGDGDISGAAADSKNWSRIGYFNEPTAGIIDEVRISNVARSADWIRFEYRNMKESDNELTWGSEESRV